MNRTFLSFTLLALILIGCKQSSTKELLSRNQVLNDSCSINFDIDTIRFSTKLTDCQMHQVFYRRNFEEDYSKIEDTSRVALRFIWWRSFHGLTIVRLENRPTIAFIDGNIRKRKIWQEWFATYKTDIQSLNHDYTIWAKDKRSGKIPPFVFQQHVEKLPVNKIPTAVQLLDSIKFWNMKPIDSAPAHTDGSYWTLQVYRNGKYHEVSTDKSDHALKSVCIQLLKLSKHPATPDEIY